MYWLFRMFNSPSLVSVGSKMTLWALNCRLPVEWAIKKTIFQQFCGGDTLENAQKTIDHLGRYNTLTVLDYGAEAKTGEEEFDRTEREMLRVVTFAGKNPTVPVISCKVTGLARFELLEKIDRQEPLDEMERAEWSRASARLDRICRLAAEQRVGVFIDAEETWIQDAVDGLTEEMMARYNRERVTVFNTFQLYRHDRLAFLKASHETARAKGYLLGAKLVRGAYMEKERSRAAEMGYPSPIQPDKAATDRDYDEAVRYCVDHYREIGSCVASHNVQSNLLQAELMEKAGIAANHPHLNFSQLYGMSDNLTFNLAKAGYNVAKYVPYGPVRDVMPYLIRRAQENSSVSGDMSRELRFIVAELERRKGKG